MAKCVAITIFLTAIIGTVLLMGAEALTQAHGGVPIKPFSLLVGSYAITAIVVWRFLRRSPKKKEVNDD
jgi:uncharacterized membrane protein